MNVVRWDPTRDLSLLHGDVNRLFGRFFEGASSEAPDRWIPPMDVAEVGEHFVVTMDVPGLTSEDVLIEAQDRVLRISGERRQERTDEHASYFRMERGYGAFERTLTLPKGVDAEGIEASFDLGVLELRIPKPAEVKPRRIAISTPSVREVGEASSGSTAKRKLKGRVLAHA